MTATTYHLTDLAPAIDLPAGVRIARSWIDRVGAVRVDDDGITLHGIAPKRVEWADLERVEIASRLDTAIGFGLRLLPVTRVPGVRDAAERLVDETADRLLGEHYDRLRELAGWTLVRLHRRSTTVDVRRLPALVLRIYPSVTDHILEEAERRGIAVERLHRLRD